MTDDSRSRRIACWVLVIVSLANYGNYYVYDSIGPVADLLHLQRSFTDSQIGMLNAIYSLPNILLLLFGGMFVDRFGAGRMMFWTGAVCLAGAALTAFSPEFTGMVAGRLLFGIGAETFNIATMMAIVKYFSGQNLAFAVGVGVAIGRTGSFSADMSPAWFSAAYAHGWQPPLVIASVLAAVSAAAAAIYWWLDHKHGHADPNANPDAKPISLRGLSRLGSVYWCLLALCVFWFAAIFAFRSTFSIKYFQHAHGLDLAAAGAINAWVFLAALFATPAFGWLCDRTGQYMPMIAFGALMLPVSIAMMALSHGSLWVATVLIGISFSLVPAVMWPLTAKIVPQATFGTALGLMWVVQNAGIAGANIAAGWLNDSYGASAQNPAGYQPMMLFFFILGALGFVFAMMLWRAARRQHHKGIA